MPPIINLVSGGFGLREGGSKGSACEQTGIADLPVITITEEALKKLGEDADCYICKEDLVVGDKMQELHCRHLSPSMPKAMAGNSNF